MSGLTRHCPTTASNLKHIAASKENDMLNLMRNLTTWRVLLHGMLAALLLAGSYTSMAATLTFDLWAKAGTTTLPDGVQVNVWGYANSAAAAVTRPGGPTLTVEQGDVVTVNLNNSLASATALLFHGQTMVPDTTGAAVAGTQSYTFTASSPGTYLYEAGLLANSQHQVAMGLYGAMVVRPSVNPLQAYADAATAFDEDAVVLLSEIDPALNANPTTFDMRHYAPKYFLINGKAYPDTGLIASSAGHKVLLRYLNAGAKHHSMGVLGLRQVFVAKDASLLPTLNHNVAAETMAPGQTGDALVTVPAAATTESRFAVYDASLNLRNSNAAGFGGMLTFVAAGTGTAMTGPTSGAVTLTPGSTNGSVAVAISATLSSSNSTVTGAEYFVDATGANGSGTPLLGSFGTASVTVSANLSTSQLAALSAGKHTIYVHGLDAAANWGVFRSAMLTLDNAGPVTAGVSLTPNPSNGSVSVSLKATANDSASGNSNVVAAEYSVDGGAAIPMTVAVGAPISSLTAVIPAGLSPGAHAIALRSQDASLNWGPLVTATLNVVAGGPVVSNVVATPNPSNGTKPFSTTQPVVRVSATISSSGSTVSAAEGFLCTTATDPCNPGAPGSGIVFAAADGNWNGSTEAGYTDIPLATVNALSNGNHTMYVRGQDAAGNWSSPTATSANWPANARMILVVDKSVPTLSAATLAPATLAFGSASSTLTVTASDVGTGVTGGQYWFDGTTTAPANASSFTGTSASINTTSLSGGNHSVRVRVQDAAGNWSTVTSVGLVVVQAVNDTRLITANTSASQTSDTSTAQRVLANDQPTGAAGRSVILVGAPVRTSGSGTGTLTLSCTTALGTAATPAVGGSTLCTNGAYRVTLNGVGTTNTLRQASKRGTFSFTYRETLNAVTSDATVTITVN
jgi:hypothetical protein